MLGWVYAVVLALLGVYGGHRLTLIARFWRLRRRGVDPAEAPPLTELPVVTVQLPLYNERFVAERLIDAVCALEWPADRLEIQVLDDSTDDTAALCAARVASWQGRGVDIRHLRRDDRAGFKAGALEHGLASARGSLLLILDADFLPPPDLVRRLAGHFADPRIGMVQVRWEHINREFSPLTRVQALLLDGHFVVEQAVRARSGKFFNFNGTAGMWRREAIESAGGWHHDTLTEDLDLSYRALLAGWRFDYLLGVAAPAELPVDMNAFKSQQFRWAKGSIQVARKLLGRVLRSSLPRAVKVEAFFHLTQNVPYLLTLVLALVAVPVLLARQRLSPLDVALMVVTTGTLIAYCVTSQRGIGRSWWRAVTGVPALIAITAGISASQARAVLEGLSRRPSEFVRTPKHGIVRRGQRWRLSPYRGARSLIPIAEIALAVTFALAVIAAVHDRQYLALPVLGLFCVGFAYVGALSALRR